MGQFGPPVHYLKKGLNLGQTSLNSLISLSQKSEFSSAAAYLSSNPDRQLTKVQKL